MSDKLDGNIVNHCQSAGTFPIMFLSKLVDLSKQVERTNYLGLKYFLSPPKLQTIKLGQPHRELQLSANAVAFKAHRTGAATIGLQRY